jgi:large subunit ribosomal protein L1
LVKSTSLSKFDGKVEAHLLGTDIGNIGEISFPHLELGSKKIVILNDAVLAEIKDGKINFDILIATPVTMPKLLPFARTLGPKGLMPNPKNGTLTDKPEESLKKLSVAKTIIKSEKKAPVIHQIVGKVSQETKELVANVEELIKIVKPIKIKKLVLCATMGPGIKVEVLK